MCCTEKCEKSYIIILYYYFFNALIHAAYVVIKRDHSHLRLQNVGNTSPSVELEQLSCGRRLSDKDHDRPLWYARC